MLIALVIVGIGVVITSTRFLKRSDPRARGDRPSRAVNFCQANDVVRHQFRSFARIDRVHVEFDPVVVR